MLSNIPLPLFSDLQFVSTVTFWNKKRLEVFWNNHRGMALFKELKNTKREIIHVIDDDTQEYVRSRAHLVVENYYNMYTLEHPNPPVWHECDDSMSVVDSLKHFVASTTVESHHLIFDKIEHTQPDSGERRSAPLFQGETLYVLTWREVASTWINGLPNKLSFNVRNFPWISDKHCQRATHCVYSRCCADEMPDNVAIRKMALEFRLEDAEQELLWEREALEQKEMIVQHMRNELADMA